MNFRPLNTANGMATNFNNINDFMRQSDNGTTNVLARLAILDAMIATAPRTMSVVKAGSVATASAFVAHGLTYTPELVYSIENLTLTPGEWVADQYFSFNAATGVLDARAYMTADATNIYLKAQTPSGTALYASALTFNAKYRIVGVA